MPSDELTYMDRITQTQDSVDQLVKIAYSSIAYLSNNANFAPLDPSRPATQAIPGAPSAETYAENSKELVTDFLRKAKQLEYLITSLPTSSVAAEGEAVSGLTKEDEAELKALEKDIGAANAEYKVALDEARELLGVSSRLKDAIDRRERETTY